MTELDVQDAVRWMQNRWPNAQRDWSEWRSLVGEFLPYTAGSMKEALNTWYRRGESKAPNPSQLIRLVGEVQVQRHERGIDEFERTCDGRHVYADPAPYDTDRHRYCVLCGERGREVKCEHEAVYSHSRRCAYCPETIDA